MTVSVVVSLGLKVFVVLHHDQVVMQENELVNMVETERLKEKQEDEELQSAMSPISSTENVTLKKDCNDRMPCHSKSNL